jgi:hypothetical protein
MLPRITSLVTALIVLCFIGVAQAVLPDKAPDPIRAKSAIKEKSSTVSEATEPKKGTLILESDVACELRLDGEAKRVLEPGAVVPIPVTAGDVLVDCVSVENRSVRSKQLRTVGAGSKVVVDIHLKPALATASRENSTSDVPRRPQGWSEISQDVVQQGGSQLNWTQSDNGHDIAWEDARRWCEKRGHGWRLPTPSELLAIFQAGKGTTACGKHRCRVADMLHLTSASFWTSGREDTFSAWSVFMESGVQYSLDIAESRDQRALCVRNAE